MRLTEPELLRLIMGLLALVLASQVMGNLFARLGQPRVIGEIGGGILLGPMVLGVLWPDGFAFMFGEPANLKPLAFAIWLGQVLLMFASGLESHDFHQTGEWKTVGWLTALGLLLPLAAGWGVTYWFDLSAYYGPKATPMSFGLVIALASAITAIPVIAKIFLDLGMVATTFARVVLAVAFIEDIVLWILLSLALNLGRAADKTPIEHLMSVCWTLAFFAVFMGIGHRMYDFVATRRWWPLAGSHPATGPVVVLLGVVWLAFMVGINPIFGGFLAGRIVANATAVDEDTREHLKGLAFGLFIPVFFAGVGLRFDLRKGFDWLSFVAFMAFSVGLKLVSTLIAGRLSGKAFWTSMHIAIALNARGAMGIILATISYDAQLISAPLYAALILVALITSQLAGWWLHRVKRLRPQELELAPA